MLKKILKKSPYSLYENYKLYKLKNNSEKIINEYINSNKIKKLQIGCGGTLLNDWLNTDLKPESNKIAYLDASQPFPITGNSFDYIYSEHLFEHLSFIQQINYLKEAYRVLKPGGKIRIATPNFDFLMNLAKNNKSDLELKYLHWNYNHFLKAEGAIFEDNDSLDVYVINNYFRDWGHQLIHNQNSLRNLISFAGFNEITQEIVSKSSDPVFANLEHHMTQITDEFNILETMVIEAQK